MTSYSNKLSKIDLEFSDKGAYIFLSETDNSIDLFIYKKLSTEDLKKALPLNLKTIENDHDCILAIFHNGYDYLGSGNIKNIPLFIKEKNMINLLTHTYDEIKNSGFKTLKNDKYYSILNFAKSQIKD